MTKQWNRGIKHPFRNRKPSNFESKLINNYKKRILNDSETYPMNISEITTMCNLPYDYEVLYVYNKISSILQRHRKYLAKGIDYFVNELDENGITIYQRYVAKGLSEDEIFRELDYQKMRYLGNLLIFVYLGMFYQFMLMKKMNIGIIF